MSKATEKYRAYKRAYYKRNKAKINKACNDYYKKHSERIKAVKRALDKYKRTHQAKVVFIEIR